MDQAQFESACGATLLLLKQKLGRLGDVVIEARRVTEIPTCPEHLSWMLVQAALFHAEGRVDKAHRWLGFVQGALAAFGVELEALKRANMPEGETFDPERK